MKRSYRRLRIDASTDAERFWPRVEKTTTGKRCWRWVGGHSGNGRGYMRVMVDGRKKQVAAHRVSWQINFGPIPDDIDVLHTCDVDDCVRPDHLYLGTDVENALDRTARGQSHRKLDWSKVQKIRSVYATGHVSQRDLAQMFGVSQHTVWEVLQGRYYREEALSLRPTAS